MSLWVIVGNERIEIRNVPKGIIFWIVHNLERIDNIRKGQLTFNFSDSSVIPEIRELHEAIISDKDN